MPPEQKQVVILGAGYGGLRAALRLGELVQHDSKWKILLSDRYEYHLLKTELHQVAAAKVSPETVAIPITSLVNQSKVDFLQGEVTHIDFVQHAVITTKAKIRYDKLVIALGSETEFFGIPGASKNAFTLSSLEDAKRIRKHIHDLFAKAQNEVDLSKRQTSLTIVVGGGGFTGVELVTELVDYVGLLCRRFSISVEEAHIVVVEAGETVLAGFDLELITQAEQILRTKGVRLLLKAPCVSVEDGAVKLKTGETIRTGTVIWTGGVRACDLVAEAGLKYGPRSRVVVNPFLESVNHPEVYVIGDNALILDPVSNRPMAPTAQLALQQADVAALNIYAGIVGAKRVRYVPKVAGQFVSLGSHDAVGWVWKFKVMGFLAWFLKRLTVVRYLYMIGGLRLVVSKVFSLFLR